MTYTLIQATPNDGRELAELRVKSMKDSLSAIGRFDPVRARERFLSSFTSSNTFKIMLEGELAGFYVTETHPDHISLSHLYVHPQFQGMGIGGSILSKIKEGAQEQCLPIKLGALRDSRSNQFYSQQGFKKTHEEEWDIYYEFIPS